MFRCRLQNDIETPSNRAQTASNTAKKWSYVCAHCPEWVNTASVAAWYLSYLVFPICYGSCVLLRTPLFFCISYLAHVQLALYQYEIVDFANLSGCRCRGTWALLIKTDVSPRKTSINQFLTVAIEGEESPYTASKRSLILVCDNTFQKQESNYQPILFFHFS